MLSDLYPLLRAVQPADLNTTLNAVATALEGRGDQLGETIETLDRYLVRFNPELPALIEDLRLTAEVSDTYADVLPEVATILRNTITTTTHARGPRGEAQGALQRRLEVLGRRRAVHPRQRRQPRTPRRAGRRAARGLREVRARVPLPARRHRRRRQAPGRGVPRLHAAHRAGDAAQPAARATARRTSPSTATKRGPYCGTPAQPAVHPGQPLQRPARLRRRGRLAHRQGHQPGRARLVRHGARATPADATSRRCSRRSSRPGSASATDDVPDLGVLLVGPMARGAEVSLR